MNEWISIDERMPDAYTFVLTYDIYDDIDILLWHENYQEWVDNFESFFKRNEVTHWQPLPEPPQ